MSAAAEGAAAGSEFPPMASLPLKSAVEKPAGGGGAVVRPVISVRSKPDGGGGVAPSGIEGDGDGAMLSHPVGGTCG